MALALATALLAPTAGARSFSAPLNTCAPTLSGQTAAGKTLTTSNGCWTNGVTSSAYKWLRCDSNGANCVTIGGATGKSYSLTSADAGHTAISLVTAIERRRRRPGP